MYNYIYRVHIERREAAKQQGRLPFVCALAYNYNTAKINFKILKNLKNKRGEIGMEIGSKSSPEPDGLHRRSKSGETAKMTTTELYFCFCSDLSALFAAKK